MENKELARDYIDRADVRVLALDLFFEKQSWANVVRESQEVVELLLKAVLRMSGIEVPRVHDVSPVLQDNRSRLPESIRQNLRELVKISKDLRRDRELAFYGSEDLTPSTFYSKEDAEKARASAQFVLRVVKGSY